MGLVDRTREQVRELIRRTGFEVNRYPPRRPGYSLDTVLTALAERRGVTHWLDVGARNGEYGAYLRQLGYRGQIVSFEPIAAHVRALRARAEADGDWVVVPSALGSEPGTADLHVAAASDFSSLRSANDALAAQFPDGARVTGIVQVPIVRLDDVFASYVPDGAPAVLKTDTQGWDLEVLRGAEDALKRVEAVQCEVAVRPLYEGSPDVIEVSSWLAERGFVPAGLFPVSYRETGEGADPLVLLECDGVFVRR